MADNASTTTEILAILALEPSEKGWRDVLSKLKWGVKGKREFKKECMPQILEAMKGWPDQHRVVRLYDELENSLVMSATRALEIDLGYMRKENVALAAKLWGKRAMPAITSLELGRLGARNAETALVASLLFESCCADLERLDLVIDLEQLDRQHSLEMVEHAALFIEPCIRTLNTLHVRTHRNLTIGAGVALGEKLLTDLAPRIVNLDALLIEGEHWFRAEWLASFAKQGGMERLESLSLDVFCEQEVGAIIEFLLSTPNNLKHVRLSNIQPEQAERLMASENLGEVSSWELIESFSWKEELVLSNSTYQFGAPLLDHGVAASDAGMILLDAAGALRSSQVLHTLDVGSNKDAALLADALSASGHVAYPNLKKLRFLESLPSEHFIPFAHAPISEQVEELLIRPLLHTRDVYGKHLDEALFEWVDVACDTSANPTMRRAIMKHLRFELIKDQITAASKHLGYKNLNHHTKEEAFDVLEGLLLADLTETA